ncbi:hypothetical protein SVIO_009540 [Streptomyces violaceusniger]|uniref:Uncharacterized protein n=1 Tax=Streptomyces violaceusniger TaxID=68280 RepID=A0A4D4KM49_STRVO|nr:hypothetical protein SVIO_009540 [Streptomyces violaceusniger]
MEGAAEEIRERGVTGTTLDDIRARTATGKSQIFHYFPGGTEELLLAVAASEAERVLEDQEPHISRLGTWSAWQNWRDAVVRRYELRGVNCPLGVLITELGRTTPAAQALTGQLISQWQAALRTGVQRMRDSGEVDRQLDADRTAAALVAAVQGGVNPCHPRYPLICGYLAAADDRANLVAGGRRAAGSDDTEVALRQGADWASASFSRRRCPQSDRGANASERSRPNAVREYTVFSGSTSWTSRCTSPSVSISRSA